MPEANQYMFTHRELLELLVKKAGLHEGKWMLMINFGFNAGNVGPSPEQASPGVMVVVANVGLTKATSDAPSGLVVDAAEINPAVSD